MNPSSESESKPTITSGDSSTKSPVATTPSALSGPGSLKRERSNSVSEEAQQTQTKRSKNMDESSAQPDIDMDANGQPGPSSQPNSANPPDSADGGNKDPASQTISMRCLIVTQDASIIIGKAGKHVNEIREKSNARVNISEPRQGNPERILTVQGPLDAVSKAFGLIVRRINDEPFDQPSLPGSRAVTIKFIIPNSRMGSVIGKGGSKIKEIQEASGARLNASESMLPNSTERILSVAGVADAVHIAVYYIGTILLEFQDRLGPTTSAGQYRQSPTAPQPPTVTLAPGAAVQQFWIPNDLVGSIIGKGGIKINEIRTQSQCVIRVTDPGTPAVPGGPVNENERLVIIQGSPMNIGTAVNLLHQRLESEKQKKLALAQAY